MRVSQILVIHTCYTHLLQTLVGDNTLSQSIHLQVIPSRPDADQVISDVMAAHRQTAEISIFVAGNLCMLHTIAMLTKLQSSDSSVAAIVA